MKDLRDKWILITGAASGIGKELALRFAHYGSNIIIADIDEPGMTKAAELLAEHGAKTICLKADMSCQQQVKELATQATLQAGQVDVLVNNAGIFMLADTWDATWPEWENMLAINLTGPLLLTHTLLPHMLARKSGHIVNICSLAGLIGGGGMAHYCTTKFGLHGFSLALRVELRSHGIGVTAVCPGFVRTPIFDNYVAKGFDKKGVHSKTYNKATTPQKVARIAVNAVRKNKSRVIITALANATHILGKISPWLQQKIICYMYRQHKNA